MSTRNHAAVRRRDEQSQVSIRSATATEGEQPSGVTTPARLRDQHKGKPALADERGPAHDRLSVLPHEEDQAPPAYADAKFVSVGSWFYV